MSWPSSPAQFASLIAGYLRLLQAERTLLTTEFQGAATRLIRGVIFVIVAAVLFLIAFILFVAAAVSVLIEKVRPVINVLIFQERRTG